MARQAAIEAAMAESEAVPSAAHAQSKGKEKEIELPNLKGKEIQRSTTIDGPSPKASDSMLSFGSDDDALFASIDLNLECYGDVTYVLTLVRSLLSLVLRVFIITSSVMILDWQIKPLSAKRMTLLSHPHRAQETWFYMKTLALLHCPYLFLPSSSLRSLVRVGSKLH